MRIVDRHARTHPHVRVSEHPVVIGIRHSVSGCGHYSHVRHQGNGGWSRGIYLRRRYGPVHAVHETRSVVVHTGRVVAAHKDLTPAVCKRPHANCKILKAISNLGAGRIGQRGSRNEEESQDKTCKDESFHISTYPILLSAVPRKSFVVLWD